jgi:hypothetical protein
VTADKVTEALAAALKLGLERPGEWRLFRSGKLEGLFPGRGGVNAEAAARALREGLIEVARTESKGKTTIEWVRLTPRVVDFLHEHESPLRALQELRAALQATREGLPAWQAEMRRGLQELGDRLEEEARRLGRRIDALGRRVEEALERLALLGPHLPDDVAAAVPWAADALDYLDRRRAGGVANPCPLPELFAALAARHPGLAVAAFHDGLRRLHQRRAVSLLPCTAAPDEMAQPEYALIDGGSVLYYVTL